MIESIVGSLNAGARYIIPLLLVGIPLYAITVKKVKVYEVFVEGAKDGFTIAVRIIGSTPRNLPLPGSNHRACM